LEEKKEEREGRPNQKEKESMSVGEGRKKVALSVSSKQAKPHIKKRAM